MNIQELDNIINGYLFDMEVYGDMPDEEGSRILLKQRAKISGYMSRLDIPKLEHFTEKYRAQLLEVENEIQWRQNKGKEEDPSCLLAARVYRDVLNEARAILEKAPKRRQKHKTVYEEIILSGRGDQPIEQTKRLPQAPPPVEQTKRLPQTPKPVSFPHEDMEEDIFFEPTRKREKLPEPTMAPVKKKKPKPKPKPKKKEGIKKRSPQAKPQVIEKPPEDISPTLQNQDDRISDMVQQYLTKRTSVSWKERDEREEKARQQLFKKEKETKKEIEEKREKTKRQTKQPKTKKQWWRR